MTRQYIPAAKGDISKLTISTWVYIPKESVDAQVKLVDEEAAKKDSPILDPRFASTSVRKRIPILEFGKSVEPRVGIHIAMSIYWEGYLGWFWWGCGASVPYFPDYTAEFWIGGEGVSRKGWFPWGGGNAYPSVNPFSEWENAYLVFFGTSASGAGTAFYYMPVWRNIFPIIPAVRYDGFNDTGLLPAYVENRGLLGPHFAQYPGGDYNGDFALPISWTFRGELRPYVVNPDRVSVIVGDICSEPHLVESEIFFQDFWNSEFQYTIQPTPTPTMGGNPHIRVPTSNGAARYFAFGDLVVVFPQRPNVTYGQPAIPSTLWYESNSVKFLLTAKWPEENTTVDAEMVPTLEFTAGGFKVDSWNHIFFTVDMTTMVLKGGQDKKDLLEWVETLAGRALVRVGLAPPYVETPPKFAMWVNGKPSTTAPVPQLTVYPSKGGHWAATPTFKMSLEGGQIGFPIIEQEKGRWKTTGPNQNIKYAYTHIYLDKYIEPTTKNLNKFFWKSKNPKFNNVIPPPDKKAAVKEFGKPDVWFYRDKMGGVEWKNLGTGGSFLNAGTKPKDFRPGPGQPVRKKATTT